MLAGMTMRSSINHSQSCTCVLHRAAATVAIFLLMIVLPNVAPVDGFWKVHGDPVIASAAELKSNPLTLGCRDSTGQLVDWWVILKLPNGTNYGVYTSTSTEGETVYGPTLDAETLKERWRVERKGRRGGWKRPESAASAGGWVGANHLNSLRSPLSRTLLPLYDPARGDSVGHVMYNDESPTGQVEFYRAHAKGVLAFEGQQVSDARGAGSTHGGVHRRTADHFRGSSSSNAEPVQLSMIGGFWLQHSAPKFPNQPPHANYSGIAHAQQLFGQHFVCLTLGGDAIESVARSLQTSFPFVYSSQVPRELLPELRQVAALIRGKHPVLSTSHVAHIRTRLLGERLTLIHKSRSLWVELYSSLVEVYFSNGMFLQTWLRGTGAMPSFCPPRTSFASLNVRLLYMKASNVGWLGLNDHSKWAISLEASPSVQKSSRSTTKNITAIALAASTRVVCLGDMNREYSQMYRGGGTVCFDHNDELWQAFSSLIIASSRCKDIPHNQSRPHISG